MADHQPRTLKWFLAGYEAGKAGRDFEAMLAQIEETLTADTTDLAAAYRSFAAAPAEPAGLTADVLAEALIDEWVAVDTDHRWADLSAKAQAAYIGVAERILARLPAAQPPALEDVLLPEPDGDGWDDEVRMTKRTLHDLLNQHIRRGYEARRYLDSAAGEPE